MTSFFQRLFDTGGEGEISLDPYPNVEAWIERIKDLPKFIPMPGL